MPPSAKGASASADALLAWALQSLRTPASVLVERPGAKDAQDRQLLRVLSSLEGSALAAGLGRWRTFCAVTEATEPIEDEVFTTQQSLRRAHAMLQGAVVQRS